jgi:hypothetical protein
MDQTDCRESIDRLRTVAGEMESIVRDIGPKLIRLAHLREEARHIREVLIARQGT